MKKTTKIRIFGGFIVIITLINVFFFYPFNLFFYFSSFQQGNYFYGPIFLVISHGQLLFTCYFEVHDVLKSLNHGGYNVSRVGRYFVIFLVLPLLLIYGTSLLIMTVLHVNLVFFIILIFCLHVLPLITGWWAYEYIGFDNLIDYKINGKVLKNKEMTKLYKKEKRISALIKGHETAAFMRWKNEKSEKIYNLPKIILENKNPKMYKLLTIPKNSQINKFSLYTIINWPHEEIMHIFHSANGTETEPIVIDSSDKLPKRFTLMNISKKIIIKNLDSRTKYINIKKCSAIYLNNCNLRKLKLYKCSFEILNCRFKHVRIYECKDSKFNKNRAQRIYISKCVSCNFENNSVEKIIDGYFM